MRNEGTTVSYWRCIAFAARISLLAFGLLLTLPVTIASATEDARNVYLLGSTGIGAGMVPAPGIYVGNITYAYGGSAGSNIELERAGKVQTGVEANAVINIPNATWVLSQPVLGGNVGFSLLLPYGYAESSADVTLTGPRGRSLALGTHDDVFAMGDPLPMAFIGWHLDELHGKLYTFANVPVGQWAQSNLANIGFNHWAVDIGGAFTWLNKPSGVEVSATAGLTYNFKNDESDYKSGQEFHLEYSIAKHFSDSPLTLGVNGYYYKQVTGDSGSAARLGSFKGEVAAIGPALNFVIVAGQQPIVVDAKFFHEFHATNRVEGDAGLLSLIFPIP